MYFIQTFCSLPLSCLLFWSIHILTEPVKQNVQLILEIFEVSSDFAFIDHWVQQNISFHLFGGRILTSNAGPPRGTYGDFRRLLHVLILFSSSTLYVIIYFLWLCNPAQAMASSSTRFLEHTQRRVTVGRTALDEWSARRRNLYLTTDKHPCSRWDSNAGSQQVSGRRPTP
jgi:hypothetical protein